MLTDGGDVKFQFPQRTVLQAASLLLLAGYILVALVAVERPWAGVFQLLRQLQQNKW